MSVGIFRGQYIVAEDAHRYIDVDAIMRGYHDLKEAAYRMKNTGEQVVDVSELLNKDNLYVTGEDYNRFVKDCGSNISVSSQSLNDYADYVLSEMKRALDQKQIELNHEAQIRDREIEREKNSF